MQFFYKHNDTTYTVELESLASGDYRATLDGQRFDASLQHYHDNTYILYLDGRKMLVDIVADGAKRYVKVAENFATTVELTDPRSRKKHSKQQGDAQLKAQMPGQVIEVSVSADQTVQAGQLLLILEAMKMEIRVTAPYEGIVRQIFVNQNDVVERDQLLIDIASNVKDED